MASRAWDYSREELAADAAVHVAGLALATAGAIAIIAAAFAIADVADAAATTVYALSLVAALAASAVYSMWPVGPMKWTLRKYDHAAIYVLIAGTYTPFAVSMGDGGLWLLAGVWIVALVGAVLQLARPGQYRRFSIALYLGLAWSGVLIVERLLQSFPSQVFWLLIAGGVVYSAGVPFHVWQKLRFHKPIWHGFVLVAAAIHYGAVMLLMLSSRHG